MSNLYELTSDLEILKDMDEIEDTKEIVSLIEAEIINKGTGIVKLDRILAWDYRWQAGIPAP